MRILAQVSALSLAACSLAACSMADGDAAERTIAPILTSEEAQDEFTFARPEQARVTHLALDLVLDFDAQSVDGVATLDVQVADGASELVLDSNGLVVGGVTDAEGNPLDWSMGEPVEGKGEAFTIALGDSIEAGMSQVVIDYASSPEAEALQWLSPEQTAGGVQPFVFSQGQAILNRSWIPTQDSPGIRQTWEARIVAPAELNVVMSGIKQGDPEDLGNGTHAHSFMMDKSVPPYLIAIAAGDIAFAELGPRSGVWAEPSVLEEAKTELVDTEAMIDAAEAIYGPYRWGRYDMIILPPSFPYGGMENPVMTFLTPTFIAGDRSNTGLVAHELAHSWSGNLVTYASWRDGWLNEGVTSYFENRISEAVFGERRANQEYALSFAALEAMVEEQGANNPATAMHTPEGISPFDTAGEAIYDKGTVFLRTMENLIGREAFDAWLRAWFDNHAFQPATSEMFIADMRENLIGDNAELEEQLMLEEWIYGTGIPSNALRPDEQVFAGVDGAVAQFAAEGKPPEDEWGGWTTAERLRFLRGLPQDLSDRDLRLLDERLDLSISHNNEIIFEWLEAALRNRYDPAVPQAEEFLARVGRNKFVAPLFRALSEQGAWGMGIAKPLYARTRPAYHSYTRGNVDPLVGWAG